MQKSLALVLLCAGVVPVAAQPSPVCIVDSGIPPVIRAEGKAEYVSQIILACTGGIAGVPINTTVTVALNTTVTSRLTGGGWSESVALLDNLIVPTVEEPNRPLQPLQLGLNAFRGKVTAPNTIEFPNITFTPRANSTQSIRLANIRVDASAIGPSATLIPNLIQAHVSATAGIMLNNPQQTVAFILPGLSFDIRRSDDSSSTVSLNGCVAHNAGIAQGSLGTLSYRLRFREGASWTSFKVRNELEAQNWPGLVYNTESALFDPSLSAVNGFNLTGVATQATRVMARFSGIPDGVSVFVSLEDQPGSGIPFVSARLVATDTNGGGPTAFLSATLPNSVVDGINVPLRQLSVTGGSALAVWEVVSANSNSSATLTFQVILSYNSLPAGGAIATAGSFAPTSQVAVATENDPVPRFIAPITSSVISILSCSNQPNIFLESVSAPARAEAGASVPVTAIVRNTGASGVGSFSTSFSLYMDANLTTAVVSPVLCSVPALNAGAATSCRADLPISVNVPAGQAVTFKIGATADSGQQVAESTKADNRKSSDIEIRSCAPDLLDLEQKEYLPIGGSGSFRVAATNSCAWSITAPIWVKLSRSSGTGSSVITYTLDENNAGDRTGMVGVGSRTFQIWQLGIAGYTFPDFRVHRSQGAYLHPAIVTSSILPNGAPVRVTQFLIAPAVIGSNACLVEYTHATKMFRLMTDNGAGWLGPTAERTGSALENQQCKLHVSSSFGTQHKFGGALPLDFLTLTIQPTRLRGTNNYYVQSLDPLTGATSGWQLLGSVDFYGVTNPDPAGIQPLSGNVDYAMFEAKFRRVGTTDHYLGYMLLLPTPNVVQFVAKGSCLIEYNRISHGLRLVDDPGTNWLGPLSGVPITPGAAPLSNSACTVDVASAIAGVDQDGVLTMRVPIRLKAGLGQAVATFAQAFDVLGNYSDMRQFGTWQNPTSVFSAPGPRATGVIGVSNGQLTLEARVSHTSGLQAIGSVHLRVARAIIDTNPCHFVYFPHANTLNLVNLEQTGLVGPDAPLGSSQVVSNGFCGTNANKVTVTQQSGVMTVRIPVVGLASIGRRNLYVNAFDTSGWLTHWVDAGYYEF